MVRRVATRGPRPGTRPLGSAGWSPRPVARPVARRPLWGVAGGWLVEPTLVVGVDDGEAALERLLRRLDALVAGGERPPATAAELRRLLRDVDAALARLQRGVAAARRAAAASAAAEAEAMAAAPTWRHHLRGSAANRIGRIQGLCPAAVERRLAAAGFRRERQGGSAVWWHPDGSRLRIDPPHRGRRNFPSDRRVHYHKYVVYPDGTTIALNDRGRAVKQVLDARGRLVSADPQAVHILAGTRDPELESEDEAAFGFELEDEAAWAASAW